MGGAPAPGVATANANGFLAAPVEGDTGRIDGIGGMLPLTGGVRGKGTGGVAGKEYDPGTTGRAFIAEDEGRGG